MRRIKLIVSYDGTNYCGWQIQINGITIEEVLNKALSKLLQEDIMVIGASRTDSGVHALGNVAVFDTESKIEPEKMCFAINGYLPDDIRIQLSEEVPLDFHPRYCDSKKTYEYHIYNAKFPNPLKHLYSTFIYYQLNIEDMKKAAAYLIGEHDFKSFCTPKTDITNTVRTLYHLDITKNENDICLRFIGNGFLYHMVRIITGTLLKVGAGVYPPEHVKEILEAKDRNQAGPTALAGGLTLVRIEY